MSPIEWYYAKGNQQIGPVSSAQMKQLAGSGGLQPDDLVWREGMEEWIAARNVKGLFGPTPPQAAGPPPKVTPPAPGAVRPAAATPEVASPLPHMPGPMVRYRVRRRQESHLFDLLLATVRAQFTAQLIDATSKLFVDCGHYGLYLAMAAGFCFTLIAGVKEDSFKMILVGAIAVLLVAVLQYSARRFCDALDRLNRTTSGTISSLAFLDCFALLCMVIGLAILILAAVLGIQNEEYWGIVSGLVWCILFQYLAFIALNPEALSISVVPEVRAGEEAIGVDSFLFKSVLRLVPVAFGVGVIYGTLRLLYACYLLFDEEAMASPELVEIFLELAMQIPRPYAKAFQATWSIISYAALPLLAYLFFLFYYLAVDVIRAILVVPGKLDHLAEKENKKD